MEALKINRGETKDSATIETSIDREEAGTRAALEGAEVGAPTSEETTATDLLETPKGTTSGAAEEMIEETMTEETMAETTTEAAEEMIEEMTTKAAEEMIEEMTGTIETIEAAAMEETTPKTGIEELRAEEASILMNLSMMNFACSDLKLRID